MKKICRNIYKTARESSGFTQEHAAELLHVSVRSLADYETGRTIPSDDLVYSMIEIYKTNWLGYQHLKQSTLVGQRYLPEVDFTEDLAKSVLRLQKEVGDLEYIQSDMISIACSDFSRYEKDKWKQVTKEILDMAGAALAVVFSR